MGESLTLDYVFNSFIRLGPWKSHANEMCTVYRENLARVTHWFYGLIPDLFLREVFMQNQRASKKKPKQKNNVFLETFSLTRSYCFVHVADSLYVFSCFSAFAFLSLVPNG